MAKLEAFELPGLELWFNSNDHLPPHFHVEKRDQWEIRVYFRRDGDEMFEKVWGKKDPTRKERKEIRQAVEAHREDLETEWAQKVDVTTPGKEK